MIPYCILNIFSFVESLGHSHSLLSVNFETIIFHFSNLSASLRTGVGIAPGVNVSNIKHKAVWSIPFVANCYLRKGVSNVFIRGGYTLSFGEDWIDTTTSPLTHHYSIEPIVVFSFGYRYINPNGALFDIYPTFQQNIKQSKRFFFGVGLGIGIGCPNRGIIYQMSCFLIFILKPY